MCAAHDTHRLLDFFGPPPFRHVAFAHRPFECFILAERFCVCARKCLYIDVLLLINLFRYFSTELIVRLFFHVILPLIKEREEN